MFMQLSGVSGVSGVAANPDDRPAITTKSPNAKGFKLTPTDDDNYDSRHRLKAGANLCPRNK